MMKLWIRVTALKKIGIFYLLLCAVSAQAAEQLEVAQYSTVMWRRLIVPKAWWKRRDNLRVGSNCRVRVKEVNFDIGDRVKKGPGDSTHR